MRTHHRLTRLWQHQTLKLNERATHHLAAMLRSMKYFDLEAYNEVRFIFWLSSCWHCHVTLCCQVPSFFKRGLNYIDACNLFTASKTQDKIQARLARIAKDGLLFAPYTDHQFEAVFAELCQVVQPIAVLKRLVSGRFV